MKSKILAIAISCSAILLAAIPVLSQISIQMDENSIRIEGRGMSVESSNQVQPTNPIDNNPIQLNPQGISVESGRNSIHIRNREITLPTSPDSNDSAQIIDNQIQQTTINLNSADLNQPHLLKISTNPAKTTLTGQIKLDDKIIQTIKNNYTEINLSPQLAPGKHTIEISGNYNPTNATVQINFTGTNTQITHQILGCKNYSDRVKIESQIPFSKISVPLPVELATLD
ncbi:hypothetical protein [Limnofasciculus baicalensis]|uniref:Secreted protein n=1 Tax=Limnofasciculus baicalensis BBK-W-15 TaxID=2699891 RepID=A0AAE3GYX0_9CYAN|nr:hypothetical protein [Limnofasciculus baicalensis]MCP2731137.1 hypothetical protein [Limnofasciculus baicalensis BBK-W-15]